MISCCAHYLTNVAPVLGATGLAFNAAGIAYVGTRLWKATKAHAHCVA